MAVNNIAYERVQKDMKDIVRSEKKDKLGITVECMGRLDSLKATLRGPPDSPYANGVFELKILVLSEYPIKPPKVDFVTKVWHPNVSSRTGAICLDVLKDKWLPSMGLRSTLISIQALLTSPEPNDPLDNVVAQQFKNHKEIFQKTAKFWADYYAQAGEKDQNMYGSVVRLRDRRQLPMDDAIRFLSQENWNFERALNFSD